MRHSYPIIHNLQENQFVREVKFTGKYDINHFISGLT